MKYRINIFIKFFIIILIIIYNQKKEIYKDNNLFEDYFVYSICKFLHFKLDYNCSKNIFIDYNFYEEISEINSKINLFINIKKTKIENIFLLIGIFPFLKNDSKIIFRINKKEIYKFFKNIFNNKKIKNKIIKFNEYDLQYLIEKFNDLINFKWEFIPKTIISNNIRYIINNYYNENCLEIFDQSLNLNYKYYINHNKNQFSFEKINYLMSKFLYYIIIK